MAAELTSPVPFSTPDNHIFTEIEPTSLPHDGSSIRNSSDEEFSAQYEIERTLQEIRDHKWKRVALQFPDEMLYDSARVYQLLARGYKTTPRADVSGPVSDAAETGGHQSESSALSGKISNISLHNVPIITDSEQSLRLTILADTSYGSCCVDEIAAEHVEADAVIHYGRTCLSPTTRLPVVHVSTKRHLDHEPAVEALIAAVPDKSEKIIVMADVPYAHHVDKFVDTLRRMHGYGKVFATDVIRDNSSLIPNRTLPHDLDVEDDLKSWIVFHISDPPTALLLMLESRVKAVHILSTDSREQAPKMTQMNTAQLLRRRYALVTSLATVSTWGILINTLSVKNYLDIVDHVKRQIADAGKKSYLFVVGKLNSAKVANFADIEGWVVIGCWESSLIDSRDFFRPIITPFELGIVLQPDEERIWTGEWTGDFQKILSQANVSRPAHDDTNGSVRMPGAFVEDEENEDQTHGYDSDEESAPPEFDLRTGRYVASTRPMRVDRHSRTTINKSINDATSTALTRKANSEIQTVNGIASPAAEYLAQKRTWRGLGSDFEIKYEDETEQGSLIEEGRTGVARGYTVGESGQT